METHLIILSEAPWILLWLKPTRTKATEKRRFSMPLLIQVFFFFFSKIQKKSARGVAPPNCILSKLKLKSQ